MDLSNSKDALYSYLLQASDHNDAGDYERARKFGNAALGCNLCVFLYYVLLVLAAIALVIVYFTVGFAWLTAISGDIVIPTAETHL